jgi:hypothetical protein
MQTQMIEVFGATGGNAGPTWRESRSRLLRWAGQVLPVCFHEQFGLPAKETSNQLEE